MKPKSGRTHHPTARLLLATASAATLLLAASPVTAASPKLTLSAGFGGQTQTGCWMPLVVRIENPPRMARGEIEVQVRTRDGRVDTYTQPADFTPRSDGTQPPPVTVCYLHPNYDLASAISARLIVDGRAVAEGSLNTAVSLGGPGRTVLMLTDFRANGSNLRDPLERDVWWTLAYPRAEELPSSPRGYQSITAIVFDTDLLPTLRADQSAAMKSWVRSGGVLILRGPPVGPVPGLEPFLSDGKDRQSGRGQVIHVAREAENAPVMVFSGQRAAGDASWLLAALRRAAPTRSPVLSRLRFALEPARDSNYWYSDTMSEQYSLSYALTGTQAVKAPSYSLVGLFLLGYIVLLVPVNYLLLKRLDRKELAWLTAPAVIAVFSVAAYAQGSSIQGGELTLRTCTVLEGTANESGFDSYTLASVYSPKQERYTLSVNDPNATAADVTSSLQYGGKPRSIHLSRDGGTSIKDAAISMWDQRTFGIGREVDLGGPIQVASAAEPGRSTSLTITNRSAITIDGCKIQTGEVQQLLGTLTPGQTVAVRLPRANSNETIAAPSPDVSGSQTRDSAALRRALSDLLAHQAQPKNQMYPPPIRSKVREAVVTGWFNGDLTNLRLRNEHPKTAGVNCLVVHIPLDSAANDASSTPAHTDKRP